MASKSSILIPLYIYPNPGAWDMLYQAAADYPQLHFTVVVNPFNGPGEDVVPDTCYQREIGILTKHSNVHVIGYIHTNYATRDFRLVQAEIDTYANWEEKSGVQGLAVEGLFVDEVPWQHDQNTARYLQAIKNLVVKRQGFGTRSKVVLNPGCVPDSRYVSSSFADSTVMFEDTYDTFQLRYTSGIFDPLRSGHDRSALACLIHSVPKTIADNDYQFVVSLVRELAGEVFLTQLDQGYYAAFSPDWRRFLSAMAAE